jgi:Flp pilus assembly protein TadG
MRSVSMSEVSSRRQAGQVLALFTFGFLAIVAGVAFVVDGGNAYTQHRTSQNATDAAALAGATVLAERLGGAAKTDSDVKRAIDGVLGSMSLDVAGSSAVYTDIDGSPIAAAPSVGSLGNVSPPQAAAGVAVRGDLPFGTYFARAIGLSNFTATTEATAIAGYGYPDGSSVLPVTPPVTIVSCDGQNDPILSLDSWGSGIVYRVPLCKNGPGNVGWIDWTPPASGPSELVAPILEPDIPPPGVKVPSWNFVAQTGNVNSKAVEDALRTYDGDWVLIPLFDATCNTQPDPTNDGVDACPPQNVGGNGQNQWYHFPEFATFRMCGGTSVHPACTEHGAYVNGNNRGVCDTGNGATSCLVGYFERARILSGYVTGPIDVTSGPTDFLVVQLIR